MMKYLNAVVVIMLLVVFSQAVRTKTPPPNDHWFQNAVAEYPRPVLVKFGAEWCPPCRHMDGVLDRAESRFSGRVKVVKIDIDQKPELAEHYGVGSIPRLFLFEDGKITASHGGFADVDQLDAWVNRYTR